MSSVFNPRWLPKFPELTGISGQAESCHRLAPRLEPNTSLKHSLNFSL